MPPSAVVVPDRVLRWGLCLLVALASALLCGLILTSMKTFTSGEMQMSAANTSDETAAMTGMSGVNGTSAMTGTTGDSADDVVAVSSMGGVMPFVCGVACADEAAAATRTLVATLSTTGLLLLSMLRRHVLHGLAPRHPSSTVRADWRMSWRLPTLSLTDMCVLRV